MTVHRRGGVLTTRRRPGGGPRCGLAGLAVVAPLAFLTTRLALTRTIPFKYSFDDHGPGHYVNALAPPGVLS
ncbi:MULTISPECIES: hypothetical protein [unclassified Streptomyces]|uniref:hypothetical protein n=1 Tax=unclassified Streptomyces TaxID=2593676 RepID=UPI0022563A66|nr:MULTISPECIES: hypothetical protein [unclassified Streptomyces]MCX5062665.1 hypothetical protein [Streptomyces sp. NBC_00452]MCX5291727.1 hypothetical protein [Streptomyces sp. NBC_00183]